MLVMFKCNFLRCNSTDSNDVWCRKNLVSESNNCSHPLYSTTSGNGGGAFLFFFLYNKQQSLHYRIKGRVLHNAHHFKGKGWRPHSHDEPIFVDYVVLGKKKKQQVGMEVLCYHNRHSRAEIFHFYQSIIPSDLLSLKNSVKALGLRSVGNMVVL